MSTSYTEPALEAVLRASLGENDLELHLGVLRAVPHLARTGDADKTVHPFWARRAVRLLAAEEMGQGRGSATSRLSELRGKEHWWWDTMRPNDGGAVNDEEMRSFFESVLGAPRTRPTLPPLLLGGNGYSLRTHNPAAHDGRGGWRILQLHAPATMASVQLRRLAGDGGDDGGGGSGSGGGASGNVSLTTRNVRRLRVTYEALLAAGVPTVDSAIVVDGERVPLDGAEVDAAGSGTIELCRLALPPVPPPASRWQVCTPSSWQTAERRPETAGPMRQAFHAPFAIVVGGGGADAAEATELAMLGTYLANLFVLTADAAPRVLADVSVTMGAGGGAGADSGAAGVDAALPYANLLLIGGPRENTATAALATFWASIGHAVAWSSKGGMPSIGGCALPSGGVGALLLGPTPRGGLALVVDGDMAGRRDAVAAGEPTIPPMARSPFSNTLPDYLVTGPDFGAKGYGGVLAAGFLDHAWRVAPAASFLAMDCVRE